MTNDQNPSLQPNVMVERYAQIADDFASSRPLIDPRPTDIVRGRYEGEQAASAEIARRIRATAPAPQVNVVGMDEEDRTPVPEGFNAAQWQRADEVHHAMALVADDAECVKILYAALAATEGPADGR